MSLIISGTTNSGIVLLDNPVTITATGYVNNSTGALTSALWGAAGLPYTILNAGLLVGKDNGISISPGGTVTNTIIGSISGAQAGISMISAAGAGSVVNAGAISGTSFDGVLIVGGGNVANLSTGTITGSKYGIEVRSNTGTVTNAGAIAGPGAYGVWFRAGGLVNNLAGGTISGRSATDGADVTNAGLLIGTVDGIDNPVSTVTNQSAGTISGQFDGVFSKFGVISVTNEGFIGSHSQFGIDLRAGGTVTNLSGGTISGGISGVRFYKGAGTILNAGSIGGTKNAVSFRSSYANRLIVQPGAMFTGTVNGGYDFVRTGTTVSTLELAPGPAPGVISGLGGQFTGFAQTTIDAGASWTLTGANTLIVGTTLTNAGFLALLNGSLSTGGTVVNNGLLQVNAATLTAATLGGSGQVAIGAGGTLTVTGTVAATETIALGAGGVLQVKNTVTNAGSIAGGFGNGVQLAAGGAVTNSGIGGISGYYAINIGGGAGTVANAGAIAGNVQYGYGIYLHGGGGVTNQIGGSIGGGKGGIAVSGGTGIVSNAGAIANAGDGFSGYALYLHGGGGVNNLSTGSIGGNHIGIQAGGAAGTVTNAGTIAGSNKIGVQLKAGGGLTNLSGGSVSGRYGGVYISGAAGTVTNAGTIKGPDNGGVVLSGGGGVFNQNGGSIGGGNVGVGVSGGTGTVANAGTILATKLYSYGVALHGGGAVTNLGFGTIGAEAKGILVAGGAGTVTNAGFISGVTAAVALAAGFANQVIVDPGAEFAGTVDGGNTIGATASSTLEFAAGASPGLMSGLGSQFINFVQTTIDAAASWTLTGVNTLAAGTTLTNAGVLAILNGKLTDDGRVINDGLVQVNAAALTVATLDGTGEVVIGGGGSLTVTGSIAPTETVIFNGSGQVALASTAATVFAGQMVLTSGAKISSQGTTDTISGTAPQAASVTVNGTGAAWVSAGQLRIGGAGLGSFAIQSGGTASAGAGAVIADTQAASGSSLGLVGAGSSLLVTGLLNIGVAGSGALSLSGGATVTAGSLDAGDSASAVGQISVGGAGTSLNIAGDATVADDGTGVLSVLNGATFSATNLTIGSQGNSSGALVVSGSGSVINLTGALNIGTALGVGDLTIGPGGAVHAAVVNLQGQVVLEGGNLDPTVTIINQGQTAGGNGTIQAGFIVDEGVVQAGGTKPSQRLLIVDGTVVGGGTLTVNGSVQPSGPVGVLQINASGTLELTGPVLNAATTTFTDNLTQPGTYTINNSVVDVTFADAKGVLLLDNIAGFAGTITSFTGGDQFVIKGGVLSNLGVGNSNTLTFSDSGVNAGSGGIDSIIFGSAVSAANFNIVNGNTVQVACFAAGTRIETAAGPVAVEDLAVGALVVTEDGRAEPIVWIGSRTIDCARHPKPETVWPIRVSAGAFGAGLPARDLYLSPDHAVFVNRVLVPVKLLANGSTITKSECSKVTYYHVEPRRHEVILAEELPVESYLDTGDRMDFGGAVTSLFPNFATRPAPDAARVWETLGAARLVMAGEELAKARRLVGTHASWQNRQSSGTTMSEHRWPTRRSG